MKSVHIVERTLPMAWERAVIACWEHGEPFPTEYDRPDDPNSRDVTAMIHVTEPLAEPRIHRAFPGGLHDLEKYRAEVLYGVHDHWIDPAAGKWEYTYHERLAAYAMPDGVMVDQLAAAEAKLREVPYTRRAQAVTWQAWMDPGVADPPCLQRLWFRIASGKLHMNCHIRSNDAYKAAFMNMYAFIELQRELAERIGVQVGDYIHCADSFHIYGSYFEEFEGFLKMSSKRASEERVWTSKYARPMFVDGCDALLREPDLPEDKRTLVQARRAELARQDGR